MESTNLNLLRVLTIATFTFMQHMRLKRRRNGVRTAVNTLRPLLDCVVGM